MNIKNVFNQFCQDLKNRSGLTTEDNVRYYWFAAMMQQDHNLNNYTLEYSYPSLPGKELDLLYQGKETLAFEMKFHHHVTKPAFDHLLAAGGLIDDLQRLQSLTSKELHRYFLYVTDDEMDKYLNNGSNAYRAELRKFYQATLGSPFKLTFPVPPTSPNTFWARACKSTINTSPITINNLTLVEKCDITRMKSASFKNKACHIRLYEVL